MTTERDIQNQIAFAEAKGEKRGLAKGRKEGEKKGLAKGEKAGLTKGREEGALQRNKEIARAMLNKGFDEKTVAEITGLDAQAIAKLPD